MSKEIERLESMLKDNKISPDEYKILLDAIEKKSSRMNAIFLLLVNPFQKIAGLYSLVIGSIVILAMSYFGVIAKIYFNGLLGVLNSSIFKNPGIPPTFSLLLYQNVVAVLVLAILYIISAKLCQQKRLRIIDFFGTVALSRIPFLMLTLFLSIIQIINPSIMELDLTKGTYFQPSLPMILFMLPVLAFGIWQIVTYFYALKESSGLSGKKLWISFISSFLIGEMIASVLTNIFF